MKDYFNGKKLVIFDLDDTLILERDYVTSGFREVAYYFSKRFSHDPNEVLDFLLLTFESQGRQQIFNKLLKKYSLADDCEVIKEMVSCYRNHYPDLKLTEFNKNKLVNLRDAGLKIAIVTDGLEVMQRNKVNALGLNQLVDLVIYCWSISAPKPDIKGFQKAMEAFSCTSAETIIIGDNPEHDIKPAVILGVDCLRVLNGRYAKLPDLDKYKATACFNSLQSIWE